MLINDLFIVKRLSDLQTDETPFRRCLNLLDVTNLGLGIMLASGIWMLTGTLVQNVVGPAVILSYLLAAACAFLSALFYTEFAGRVPRAGSAYIYGYVTIGEIVAFVIGWSLLIEYSMALASISKTWSAYADSMINRTIERHVIETLGVWHDPGDRDSMFNYTLDIIAIALNFVIASLAAIGVRSSLNVLNVFCFVNISMIVFVVTYGWSMADFDNWLPLREDGRGFTPFGLTAILTASSSCFFAYTGFEGMCTVGEETKDPRKTVPRALMLSITVATIAYVMMSSSLTLMLPFDQVNGSNGFSDAFIQKGHKWASIFISTGALSGLTSGLIINFTSSSRLLYAMAKDGLLYEPLAYVNETTKTPLLAILVVCITSMLGAAIFTIQTLVEFVAIDTIMAYSTVVVCVLVLRYRPDVALSDANPIVKPKAAEDTPLMSTSLESLEGKDRIPRYLGLSFLSNQTLIWLILSVIICNCLVARAISLLEIYFMGSICLVFLSALLLYLTSALSYRRQYKNNAYFQVKLVPWLPIICLQLNLLLIVFLPLLTWIRFAIGFSLGLLIYCSYGYRHSHERQPMIIE